MIRSSRIRRSNHFQTTIAGKDVIKDNFTPILGNLQNVTGRRESDHTAGAKHRICSEGPITVHESGRIVLKRPVAGITAVAAGNVDVRAVVEHNSTVSRNGLAEITARVSCVLVALHIDSGSSFQTKGPRSTQPFRLIHRQGVAVCKAHSAGEITEHAGNSGRRTRISSRTERQAAAAADRRITVHRERAERLTEPRDVNASAFNCQLLRLAETGILSQRDLPRIDESFTTVIVSASTADGDLAAREGDVTSRILVVGDRSREGRLLSCCAAVRRGNDKARSAVQSQLEILNLILNADRARSAAVRFVLKRPNHLTGPTDIRFRNVIIVSIDGRSGISGDWRS